MFVTIELKADHHVGHSTVDLPKVNGHCFSTYCDTFKLCMAENQFIMMKVISMEKINDTHSYIPILCIDKYQLYS